ncbi:MAG: HlyD family efflux transporter periplasmic adaptor subunit [Clostridiales bacterium]|nr:HlyD family efflux transporter periplasmic adaptor subunit [Clostridiales bacterium]
MADKLPVTPELNPNEEPAAAVAVAEPDDSIEREDLEEVLTFKPEIKSKRSKIIKRVILWTVLLAIVAGISYVIYLLFFKPEDAPEFETAMAYYTTIENKVQGSGSISAQDKQDVLGLAKGEVRSVLVGVGDTVEVGQPLLVVDDEEIINELNEKQQALTQAGKDVDLIYEEMAGQNLRAAFAGKTLGVTVEKGAIVSKGDVLAVLADDSKMKLVAYYSTIYQEAIKVGQRAQISIPKSMAEVEGTVSRIENIAKITDEGTVLFEVEVLMDNPGTLTKGMMATAMIETEAGLVTPAEAGALTYNREENIKAKTKGEILSLAMRDYYAFAEGETLLTMVNEDLESRLSDALKSLEAARKSYDLVAEQYKYYSPLSEINGTVLAVNVMTGDKLSGSSDTLISIADTRRMIMNISVDEMYVSQLVAGMPATVTASYDTGAMYEGVLSSLAMQAEIGTGMSTFPGKIEVFGAEGLMSGMWLDYEIITNRTENCLAVPSNAVKYVEGGTVCFVRTVQEHHEVAELDEMTASQVPEGFTAVWVETGASDAMNIEITKGLAEMDEVATTAIVNNPYGMY